MLLATRVGKDGLREISMEGSYLKDVITVLPAHIQLKNDYYSRLNELKKEWYTKNINSNTTLEELNAKINEDKELLKKVSDLAREYLNGYENLIHTIVGHEYHHDKPILKKKDV